MANVLQIKRTTQAGTSTPGTDDLAFGELAWSNGTNRLFIGRQGATSVAAKEVGTRRATGAVPGIASFSSTDFNIGTANYGADTGSTISLKAVASSILDNNTVSFGGVSVALGASDATPAFDLADATGYYTSQLVGYVTNSQLHGSIANNKLSNSSVSFGGVSVALGASDATPAFDLQHATGYKTSSLSGTITNAQLAGSIANDKLAGSIANGKLANSAVTIGTTEVSLGGTTAGLSGLTQLNTTAANHTWAGSLGAYTLTLGGASSTIKIAGDLEVAGTNTIINSTTVETADDAILLKKGNTSLAGTTDAGIEVDAGSNTNPTWTYNNSGTQWQSSGSVGGTNGNFSGNVSGTWNGGRIARSKSYTIPQGNVLGRTSAGTGDADQSASEIRTLLGTGNSGVIPAAGSSGQFLQYNGSWGTPANDNTQLSDASVQAIVGAMFSSNTETRIDAAYNAASGKINLVVDAFPTGDITGITTAASSGLTGGQTSGTPSLAIGALAVVGTMLAADCVTSAKIGDDQINNTHIADNAVRRDMINNDEVSYSKMQNVATDNRILGNNSGANSEVEELTGVEVLAMLGAIDGGSAVTWS